MNPILKTVHRVVLIILLVVKKIRLTKLLVLHHLLSNNRSGCLRESAKRHSMGQVIYLKQPRNAGSCLMEGV